MRRVMGFRVVVKQNDEARMLCELHVLLVIFSRYKLNGKK